MILENILFGVFCLLCGSLNGAVLVASCCGLPDLRLYGSGNPGATNATRAYGLWAGFIVFLIDASKAFDPILAAKSMFSSPTIAMGIFMSVIGHCFSPWLNFQGGKGVATLIGGILAFDPILGLWSIGVWMTTYLATKLSALSALIMIAFIFGAQIGSHPFIGVILSLLVVFVRHYPNWQLWVLVKPALSKVYPQGSSS